MLSYLFTAGYVLGCFASVVNVFTSAARILFSMGRDEILGMMSETTYMTGTEAAAKGFADAIIDDAEPLAIAASQDGRALYIGSRTVHLAPGMTAPESLQKTEAPEAWRERMLARLRHKEE